MAKFRNKYRIESARHPSWDYSKSGIYFITICTKNFTPFFGEIQSGIMCLNDIGSIAYNEWLKTSILRPDMNLKLGNFIIMPDHMHGIIIIGKNKYNTDNKDDLNKKFGPQRKNLSSIIRRYKSAVTIQARKINPDFKWQSRFHDSILWDDSAFQRVQSYIADNPKNWAKKN